ncbi:hypothetical protein AB0L10_40315 [Streptomyces flaveolus]|uniref:hypothetical protein n=1 Tax=Streptomyces flaveolus TaxID=67297 RepID=UPI003433E94E
MQVVVVTGRCGPEDLGAARPADHAVVDRIPSAVAAVPVTDLPPTTLAFCWSPAGSYLLALADSLAAGASPVPA